VYWENTPPNTTPEAGSIKSIAESIMLSKEYLETARTLLRVARNLADQAVAGRLKAYAEGCERRAEQASDSDMERS
jgi:hypothetical protein